LDRKSNLGGFTMVKFNLDFRIKVVTEYLIWNFKEYFGYRRQLCHTDYNFDN